MTHVTCRDYLDSLGTDANDLTSSTQVVYLQSTVYDFVHAVLVNMSSSTGFALFARRSVQVLTVH